LGRIAIASTLSEIDGLRDLWLRLERANGGTLFQSFRWNRLAAEMFWREAPYIVAAETTGGAAIIPACFAADGRSLSLIGEALFDYRDLLHEGDDDALLLAWRALAELRLPLQFAGLRGEHAHECWEQLGRAPFSGAPGVRAAASPDFLTAHSHQPRQLGRMERLGVTFARHNGEASELVRHVVRSKAEQLAGGDNNVFADPLRIEFMVRAAAMEGEACEILCLERGSDLVSAVLTFRDGNVRRCYATMFDPAWAQYSPGAALLWEVTRRSLADGLDCDFLTGEQSYKMRLATHVAALDRVEASAESVAGMAAWAVTERRAA